METKREEIECLMNLLNVEPRRRYVDSDDEEFDETQVNDTKDNVEEEIPKKKNPYTKLDPQEEKEMKGKEVYEDNEFFFDEEKPSTDWKKTPKWEISYRQQITPTDVFLQMGPKNPSTACCEDMLIDVWLPSDKRQNIDLKVMNTQLKLFSPNHFLDIPLPHPVNPQKGNAQWNNNEEKLTITLKIDREFDVVNF
ncbi:hypothetical protein HHI36_005221 [Cryptolaemus montrouzieri]|uniref:PIH1D1/2/3 CS-like domain-containing protein n=1 Tax=Cryptolaemus montrouzieri TaxID=559131 RepID=A0ABD2NTH3_9CUCU